MIQKLRLLMRGKVPFALKELYLPTRQLNADARALPDFLIIGAQKAGTTSLFNYLCLHPRVIGSLPKEVMFFDSRFDNGERWYRRHFPTCRTLARRRALCGEATPTYLYSATAARLAFEMVPQAKIIVLLREPAARAVSNYHHRVRAGRESRPIDEIFTPETIQRWQAGKSLGESETIFFERSHYARGLRVWSALYPREQILVLEAEALFADPQAVFDTTCRFLGLEPFPLPTQRAFNTGVGAGERPLHFDELVHGFSAANAELNEIGFPMSWSEPQSGPTASPS